MKVTAVLPLLAMFNTAVNAKALLAVFEDEVRVGKSYDVEWLEHSKEVCSCCARIVKAGRPY